MHSKILKFMYPTVILSFLTMLHSKVMNFSKATNFQEERAQYIILYSFINSLTVDKNTLFLCLSNLSLQYFLLRNPTKYTLCLQFHVKNYQSTGCKKFNIYIFVSYPPSSCSSCFWCKVKYHSDFYCFDIIVFHPSLLS